MIVFNTAFVLCCFSLFAFRRLLRYLHIFQQEEYDARRFLPWLIKTVAIDKRLSVAIFVLWIILQVLPHMGGSEYFFAALLAIFSIFEKDPRKVAKKKLILTQRAKRITAIAFTLCLIAAFFVLQFQRALLWIVAVQFIPITLALANISLMPFEAYVQKKIMRDAAARLKDVNPKVIGITGSFGKTSVKHILGHILEMNAATLYTPGSVNTLMGVSRIIRERLISGTLYFIVEMGAYGIGSIKRLCNLTPPNVGIITALGEAHYERFKSLNAVAQAKFELAEAVVSQPSGKLVIHESVLAQEYANTFVDHHRDKFVVCGAGVNTDLKISNIEQTQTGLKAFVEWKSQSFDLFAPLFGTHHAGNMALAFASALILGIPADRAVAALRTVPQIKHRLEVKTQADGTIYIDDGFNSNPQGFAAALELLSILAVEKTARRILITPGIVELGEKHDDVHKALGLKAAQNTDIVLVVRADRIPTFVKAFQANATQKPLHSVTNLAEALVWVKENGRAGDIILIENDLPDLGEAKLIL